MLLSALSHARAPALVLLSAAAAAAAAPLPGCSRETRVVVTVEGPTLPPVDSLQATVENGKNLVNVPVVPPDGAATIDLPASFGLVLVGAVRGIVQVCVDARVGGGSAGSNCASDALRIGGTTRLTILLGAAGCATDCSELDDPCHTGSCDAGSFTCIATDRPDGTSCDDGLFCTDPDTCTSGACGGDPRDCSGTGDICSAGGCDEAADVCTGEPLPDGSPCSDGSFCTTGETCAGGACTGGAARDCSGSSDACNTGVCNETANLCEGMPVPDSTPCDDGLFCTSPDACVGGACSGPPRACPMLGICAAPVCDEVADMCVNSTAPDGTPCSDGDPCTSPDTCTSGSCSGPDGVEGPIGDPTCTDTLDNDCDGRADDREASCCDTSCGACAGGCCNVDCAAGGCNCSSSCFCNLDCTGGGPTCTPDCTTDCAIDCVGGDCSADCRPGAYCDVDCYGASQCAVQCHNGSICDVDCTASSDCVSVRCEGGPVDASCIVNCGGVSPCTFEVCATLDEMSCPGGYITCNASCP